MCSSDNPIFCIFVKYFIIFRNSLRDETHPLYSKFSTTLIGIQTLTYVHVPVSFMYVTFSITNMTNKDISTIPYQF